MYWAQVTQKKQQQTQVYLSEIYFYIDEKKRNKKRKTKGKKKFLILRVNTIVDIVL